LGDGHLACDGLVGITLDQATQNGLLPSRQLRCVAGPGLMYLFILCKLGRYHFTIITIIIVIRLSVIRVIFVVSCVAVVTGWTAVAAAVLSVRDESQNFRRQNCHTEHDQ